MNGKDLVTETLERSGRVKVGLETENVLANEGLLKELEKALAELDSIKNKPSLRTKDGTNLALPVMEAGQQLEQAWDERDLEELETRIEEFIDAVAGLAGALKSRTVIMT